MTTYISNIIQIGDLSLGGSNPVRLQSMTNTDTMDTAASVAQCIRIIETGGELVRLTAQGIREAENLALIKKELRKAGFSTPLVADIHFNPSAAETAARLVEKVRINPGNYTDKRAAFQSVLFTEKEYTEELERIHSRLLPLIKICLEHGTAIRIGINHGSLSDRIMTRHGNTPQGMVQSALEFIKIFRNENFTKLVLSMKSSDTSVMVRATRMLVAEMHKAGVAYPVHLGVTEAGEGEDGRLRSAAGIGALLSEGIGDTIRVSLSEDPEKEIPVARKIADLYSRETAHTRTTGNTYKTSGIIPEPFRDIRGPIVAADLRGSDQVKDIYISAGFRQKENGEPYKTDGSADIILSGSKPEVFPDRSVVAVKSDVFISGKTTTKLNLLSIEGNNIPERTDPSKDLIFFRFDPYKDIYAPDRYIAGLADNKESCGIILNPVFHEDVEEDLQVKAAGILGRYIIDEQVAGICISNKGDIDVSKLPYIAFGILQCTGKRITRTVYLSCPTCGRTKFNLQEAVQKVKVATSHFKGLKIAVMGCIVNGPGEMAGADYGYVGSAPGKVHIYKGMVPVLKNVPEKDAVKELLRIIETDNKSIS